MAVHGEAELFSLMKSAPSAQRANISTTHAESFHELISLKIEFVSLCFSFFVAFNGIHGAGRMKIEIDFTGKQFRMKETHVSPSRF